MGYFRAAGLARMRRTEVRPMCRLGNSDFRLWGGIHVPAQITAPPAEFVQGGRQGGLTHESHQYTRLFLGIYFVLLPARASTAGGGQVQRLRQRDETDTQVFQFLEGRQQIRNQPAPAVQ